MRHERSPRADARRQCVVAVRELVDDDVETVAIESRDPALEIAAHRAVPQERGNERDAAPFTPALRGRSRRGRRETRRHARGVERRCDEVAVRRLQRDVVLALVGEQEVGPAQLVEHARRGHRRRAARQLGGEPRDAGGVGSARLRERLVARDDHRQRERLAEARAQERRIVACGPRIGRPRIVHVVALGERPRERESGRRVVGAAGERPSVAVDRTVEVACAPRDARDHQLRRALSRIERERASRRFGGARIVAFVAARHREVRPAERVAGVGGDRAPERRQRLGRAADGAERVAVVVPVPCIRRIEPGGMAERVDRELAVAGVRRRDAERVPRARVGGGELRGTARVGERTDTSPERACASARMRSASARSAVPARGSSATLAAARPAAAASPASSARCAAASRGSVSTRPAQARRGAGFAHPPAVERAATPRDDHWGTGGDACRLQRLGRLLRQRRDVGRLDVPHVGGRVDERRRRQPLGDRRARLAHERLVLRQPHRDVDVIAPRMRDVEVTPEFTRIE